METNEAPQQIMHKPEPQAEHRWLQRLTGDWTYESEALGPDNVPVKMHGTDSIRAFGDLWIITDSKGQILGGGQHASSITLGYDPQQGRFVGTFIDSITTYLWIYNGSLEGDVLTLEAEGPGMEGDGKMAQYRDIFDVQSDDYFIFRSRVLGDDGQWHEFMATHYRRKR
jgi:hypothetical protein